MKVLWFTYTFLPGPTSSDLRAFGSWMNALFDALCIEGSHELAVASARPARHVVHAVVNGIDTFVVPCGKREMRIDERKALEACGRVIKHVQPDLIHVHGTERSYGLLGARGLVPFPVVISLQGLLGPCSEW